jgi:hypothetical protein
MGWEIFPSPWEKTFLEENYVQTIIRLQEKSEVQNE